MTRRVLVLNHFAVSAGSPGGTRHVELFECLADSWICSIVAADRSLYSRERVRQADERFTTVPTIPYRTNGLMRIGNWLSFAVGAIAVGLTTRRPHVVYASSPHLLAGLAGFAIARIRRAAFILEVRDLWPEVLVAMGRLKRSSLPARSLSALAAFLYRRADAIVVLAEGSVSAVRSAAPDTRVEVIPNGVDTRMFAGASPDQSVSEVSFVYAGAHGPANGLDLLIDAAEELEAEGLAFRVVLIGDGVAKPDLVASVETRGMRSVSFRPPVAKRDIPDALAEFQVGLHVLADVELFRDAVSPNKVYDYLAVGLPVITNTPGEVGSMVEAAGAGVCVAPRGLAEGMRKLIEAPPSARERHGESGRQWVRRNRDRRVQARRLGSLLDDVADA